MATMKELLSSFKKADGVEMAAVIGTDGLVIESIHKDGIDVDEISAMADNGLAIARALGHQMNKGEPLQTILEYERGVVLLESLGEDALLLVISEKPRNLGSIRFLAHRSRKELIEALAAI